MSWLKVQDEDRFLDLSDYGRPIAGLVVNFLKNKPVTPHHVTFSYLLIGLFAAYFFSLGEYWPVLVGAFLIQIKNILDGADGSLARARNKTSRIGRFLDTNSDFVVNLAVYFAIAIGVSSAGHNQSGLLSQQMIFWLAGGALLFGMIQCSYFNYYYVAYRRITGGDTTSRTDERRLEKGSGSKKQEVFLWILHKFYLGVYGWQDWFVGKIVRSVECLPAGEVGRMRSTELRTPNSDPELVSERIPKGFMTFVTFLGLGTQILFINIFSLMGKPEWFFYFILGPCNIYLLGLIVYRSLSERLLVKRLNG
jgi:phosphatidylglycerophosphate synthase